MFKPVEKAELHQVSLTGMRAIVLLGLLMQAPRTMTEIKQILTDLNIMEGNSDDIIRIDLTTLRSVGCEITQATRKTEYKYVLTKTPFAINISDEEIDVIKKIYKKIKAKSDINLLLDYHDFFNTLANCISDESTRENLYGISVLKSFNCNMIKDLLRDCKSNYTLDLVYNTPTAKNESKKSIVAQELVFQNDKIYLYGFDRDKSKSVILNVQRIKSILSRYLGDDISISKTVIRFLLKDIDIVSLDKNEQIIENLENGYLIEGSYYNDFIAIQRVLSFGANCTVIDPEEFKIKVIDKLKSMRNVYGKTI